MNTFKFLRLFIGYNVSNDLDHPNKLIQYDLTIEASTEAVATEIMNNIILNENPTNTYHIIPLDTIVSGCPVIRYHLTENYFKAIDLLEDSSRHNREYSLSTLMEVFSLPLLRGDIFMLLNYDPRLDNFIRVIKDKIKLI